MRNTIKFIPMLLLSAVACFAADIEIPAPENPATGIWIQQIGDIVPHAATKATLYYTKFREKDRVKSISYQYNGAGYLLMKPSDRKTLCTTDDGMQGADGIVHHTDGDLLVAAQGTPIHKISKTAKDSGRVCLVRTAQPTQSTNGFWHLMMDPKEPWLWASGIPGHLYRFSTATDAATSNLSNGYYVKLRPNFERSGNDQLTTVIWDGEGRAFFTYSDYKGGGCEKYDYGKNDYGECTESERKKENKKAYFGVFTDTTWVDVTKQNQKDVGGKVGDKVIQSVGTKILIDGLEGAHGGTYDTYSKTIFVFGGARIVQIRPHVNGKNVTAEVVATIDLRKYFFVESYANMPEPRTWDGGPVGWRLDQGTTDGYGHLFVASNTGHMVFVDFAANPEKLINDNVLIHVQYVDKYLDDLAPLSGVGVIREGGHSGGDEELSSSSQSSSSLVEYHESSSSAKSSSSNGNGGSSNSNGSSSSGTSMSSAGNGNSSGGDASSSGSNSGSSNSNGGSSNSNGGSSNSNGSSSDSNGGNSSGNENGSSGNDGTSSAGDSNMSSGGNGGHSSSNSNGGNSSSGGNGNGEDEGGKSSSSKNHGSGEDEGDYSSSSNKYYGVEDEDDDDDDGLDMYPTMERFEKGDSIVSKTVVLAPTDPNPDDPNVVVINGNSYKLTNSPVSDTLDLHYNSGLDSAKVGDVVAITLDPDKVKKYFGDPDSLKIVSRTDVQLIDPATGEKTDYLEVNADGSVTIFVTADKVVQGGSIKVFGGNEMVIIDNINFYDPIPDTYIGYIKDTDGDMSLDYVEILLKDSLPESYVLDGVQLVIDGKVYDCVNPELNTARDRIYVDKLSEYLVLPPVGEFPKDAKALVSYRDKAGSDAAYVRESPIVEVGSNVIKDAYAIRSVNGMDSLFLQYNIDLFPVDVSIPEMMVMLKQDAERYGFDVDQIKKVYMPAKDIVIFVGKSFKLKGDYKDSVSLYPGATFTNLPYITSDEYEREVPVKVVDRFPQVQNVEYWDTDGDGVLDQIVAVFDKKLTKDDIDSTLYMTFPWYSYRGMMIQLQAQPADLRIDPKDSTRVIWEVFATTRLASGVTSISEDLPQANIYTYYKIFGETFVNEDVAPLVDKMAPVVASATLDYGKKADTLLVVFSEPIHSKDLKGVDYFSYVHGEEVIELNPTRIDWSADGLSAKLVFNGSDGTIMPGDSIMVRKGAKDAIKDNYDNIAGENPQSVIIGGLLNHLVEATTMGSFDLNDDTPREDADGKTYTLQTVSSVNLRYMPGSTTKEDMEKEGALGQLVQLGERFVPQLLDRAQVSADGSYDPTVLDSLKPEDVYISFIVNYFDHLGQYVNDTIITVPCNSPKFGGNCLETDKKVFVNWNFKDHKGRFVGTGVYNVQFKMVVRYEDKKIVEEIKDKWGVRRKKHKK